MARVATTICLEMALKGKKKIIWPKANDRKLIIPAEKKIQNTYLFIFSNEESSNCLTSLRTNKVRSDSWRMLVVTHPPLRLSLFPRPRYQELKSAPSEVRTSTAMQAWVRGIQHSSYQDFWDSSSWGVALSAAPPAELIHTSENQCLLC